ncbi:hypothetical protein BBJ28_00014060 [Nothophytophthora sp. Chile5]|nr:hypothetical protein BBJ28_00014060 [Nothophytophthora sp. Chile5]
MTPDKTARIGKKVFDGRVRQWRQALHTYDPPELVQANETPAPTVVAADRASATSSKQEASSSAQENASSGSGASAPPAGQTMKPDSAPAPEIAPDSAAARAETLPTRSIYENFEEGEFDQEDSDDDDLL